MKLLMLLIALLAGTYLTSSKPTPTSKSTTTSEQRKIYHEILENLLSIHKSTNDSKSAKLNSSINITTPHLHINPCECEVQFEKHLSESMNEAKDVLESDFRDNVFNILDNLQEPVAKKESLHTCNFYNRTIHNLSEFNKILIKNNINFIQKWNTICK